jgi:hypothetical protein
VRVLRVVTIGVIAGLAAVWFLRASGRFAAPARSTAPKSLEQQRTEEIFRANAALPSDPDLTSQYRAINTEYFENRLPDLRIRWEPRLEEIGPLIADGFRMGGVTDGTLILLNPAVQENADEFRRVLCHEIVHIAAVSEREPHGPVFQAYLKQLLDKGAFTGIIATDAEKEERRRYLDRRGADLAADVDLLARTRSAIEAEAASPRASPDDLTARSTEYNDRVRRHNDAVVDFNRSIEEYNQMVSYPDGLDRERLARRPTLPR